MKTEKCKSIDCQNCKNYWPFNSIAFMQTYCFNQKRSFETSIKGENLVREIVIKII